MSPIEDTRLLLVDDEPNNLQVLRHILQDHYRLLFARDGEKALQLAAASRPDLILLDVMMPGMTGLEVCRQLKQNPQTAALPVIFVTALSDSKDEAEGFAAGAVDYISKPVSPPIVCAGAHPSVTGTGGGAGGNPAADHPAAGPGGRVQG
jgi:putative two-component system response regulator